MAYRWVEHTGELEVELEADTERGVFAAGFEAMRELLTEDAEKPARPLEVDVRLPGEDRAALVADWLGELAFLAEAQGLLPERLVALELDEQGLRARIAGRAGTAAHLVKAATYHRLSFEPCDSGWRARVVLDV